jgi:hypothetical protein
MKNKVPSRLWSWALLGYYAASSENFLPTSQEYLSLPSSGFKIQRRRVAQYGVYIRSSVGGENVLWKYTYGSTEYTKLFKRKSNNLMKSLTELSVICGIAGEWKKPTVPSALIPVRCNHSKMAETVLSKWVVIKGRDPEHRDFTLSTATLELLSSIATEQFCFVREVLASSLERCYPTVVLLSPSMQCLDWPRPLPST